VEIESRIDRHECFFSVNAYYDKLFITMQPKKINKL